MPFSSGTFTRTFDCTTDRDNGVKILASKFDTEFDGIATGLSTCILKDGTQTCTAAIPFAEGLTVPDNKTIVLGTNSDITIQYDETTNDALEIAANVEGAALGVVLKADQGDDNSDSHKLNIANGGVLTLQSKISGGFVTYLTHTPNATVTSSTTTVAGNLTVAGEVDGASLDISGNADIDGTISTTGIDVTGTVTADGLTVDGGANALTRTSSGAEVDALELRNNATATDTATTLKFANSTAAGSNSGSTELVAIRTGTNTGDFVVRVADSTPAMQERLRIDSSGNLLVGKSSTSTSTVGGEINPDGTLVGVRNGGNPLFLNRLTSDGAIATFRKDGTTVGSISSSSGKIAVTLDPRSAATTGSGFLGGDGAIFPSDKTGVASDADVSLGGASTRFNDLYLSGSAYLGGTAAANALSDYEEGVFQPKIFETGSEVGDAAYNSGFTGGQYTKIGRMCFITLSIRLTSKGTVTASNTFQIGNLPFVPIANIRARTAVSLYDHVGAGIDTTGNTNGTLMGLLTSSGTVSFRVSDVSGTTGEIIQFADIGDSLYLQLSFFFETS